MTTIDRMINEGRPADEVALAMDGSALRWLLENGSIQPDDRGEWSIVYICTESVPVNRAQAIDLLRNSALRSCDSCLLSEDKI